MSSNSIANELHAFATAILPFNRSLTGEGVFKTLTFIQSFYQIYGFTQSNLAPKFSIGWSQRSGRLSKHT